MSPDQAVAVDTLLETGSFKVEEFGPGIVVRRAWWRWLTLRCGWLTPAQHLHLRGSWSTDFGAVVHGTNEAPGEYPGCYMQEDLGNL